MGQLEPDDSRNVTLRDQRAPGEPPRTGPREGETRGESRQQQQQGSWRSDPSGQSQHQSQSSESDWRATEGREAQDHEFAGDTGAAPSLRAEADDGQWAQDPVYNDSPAQPQQGVPDYASKEDQQRGPRESMRQPGDDAARRDQAERGGG